MVTPDRVTAVVNDSMVLTCMTQDPALGDIQWEKMDGYGIFQPVDGEVGMTLTIDRVMYDSGGTFRCTVNTALFGELNSTTSLFTG